MNRCLFLPGVLALALVIGCMPGIAPAQESHRHGGVAVADAWARATPPGARNGAVYLKIIDNGEAADKLTGAASDVAARTTLHTHMRDGDIMRMRAVEHILIVPDKPVTLQPGGYHVMLFGLKKPLKEGARFSVELTFEKAGSKRVEVRVQKMGARKPDSSGGMHHNGPGH